MCAINHRRYVNEMVTKRTQETPVYLFPRFPETPSELPDACGVAVRGNKFPSQRDLGPGTNVPSSVITGFPNPSVLLPVLSCVSLHKCPCLYQVDFLCNCNEPNEDHQKT